jgi:synaptojanin
LFYWGPFGRYLLIIKKAHEEKLLQRNSNIYEISKNLGIGNNELDITQFEHVFFMGDLNYRIDLPYLQAVKYINEKELKKLLDYDQLGKEMKHGTILNGFNEQEIGFYPTFKYEIGKRTYKLTVY